MAMIKKSRKILTLLLASLLIMSSMCALTVSAATSFSVPSNGTVVTNDSNTASYTFTNTNETGWYELSVTATPGSGNTSTSKHFNLTATIGDASWMASWTINASKAYPTPGSYYLEKDTEYTLNLSFDLSQVTTAQYTVSAITFTKVEDIDVSAQNETLIPATKHLNFSGYRRNNNTEAMWETYQSGTYSGTSLRWAAALAGAYGIWRVNIPVDTYYDVYAIESSRSSPLGKFTLYVDDEPATDAVDGSAIGLSTTFSHTKMGTVRLSPGAHNLKVTISNFVYFAGIKLVPQYSLSATDTTIIDALSYTSLDGKLGTNYNGINASGILSGKDDIIGLKNDGAKVYYEVSSPETQKYSISFVAGRPQTQTFKITNTATGEYIQTAFPDNISTGSYNAAEHTMGELTLPQGISNISIEATTATQIFIFEIRLTPVVQQDPIFTFTDGNDDAVDDVVADTMKLNVDLNGNDDKDLVIFAIYRDNGEYAVLEYSEKARIENGIATATINIDSLADNVNYYAKAFVWDDVSYYGFVQTLDK